VPLTLKASVSRVAVRGDIFLALTVHDAFPMHVFEQPVPAIPVPPHARRRAMTSQQASEVEKRAFSRKLYDDIGQRLSVLKLDLSWLENRLPDTSQVVPARLAEMQGLLDNVITLTKSMASTLRPPVLDDFGLLPAVEWMAESFRKRTAISCVLESEGVGAKLDDALESAVFRVVQEGLANIERHSHAGRVWITLCQSGRQLEVGIRDDGIGLEGGSQGKPGCYGLVAMQERVFVLGGTIRIDNIRPHGVQIQVCMPLEPAFPSEPILNAPLPAHDTNRNR
jgi:signal transduction histidine kinase